MHLPDEYAQNSGLWQANAVEKIVARPHSRVIPATSLQSVRKRRKGVRRWIRMNVDILAHIIAPM
jgi:hypothetical protein